MMCLAQNKQPLFYALYQDKTQIVDSNGNKTGQWNTSYSSPVEVWMNISAARGTADVEQFGINDSYTRTLVTDNVNCPISTDSVLWIGNDPTSDPYNYRVVRVAKSLNSSTYAIEEVSAKKVAQEVVST